MSDQQEGYRADWAEKDFYAVLGLSKGADAGEIKKAYKKLARDNHPDTHPDDPDRLDTFKAVAEAYAVLGDTEKRGKYDELRRLYASGGFPGGYAGGYGGGGGGGFSMDDLMRDRAGAGGGGFGDLFGDLFNGGGRRAQPRPAKGADAETTTTISFTDAIDGVTVSLRLTSDSACTACNGTGGKPGTSPHTCPQCGGSGAVTVSVGGGFGMNETCPSCGGRQIVYDQPCPVCNGSGHGLSSRTISARIPAGVKDGTRIRLRGKGSPGRNGGPSGDLFVVTKVRPHRVFGRKGDDLTIDVPVSFDELALGADVRIPTLGGNPVTLKVPAGTPDGRTFRVRGKGVPGKSRAGATTPPGDLMATVQVQVPATLDATAREALEAYRAATAGKPLRANLFEEA